MSDDEWEIDLRDRPTGLSRAAIALNSFALRHLLHVGRASPHVMLDELALPLHDLGVGLATIDELCDAHWWSRDERIVGCYEITELGLDPGRRPA